MNVGGERMAKETIQAVRKAELNAARMEKEAGERREAILAEAQQDARSMITSMTKEAAAKAAKDLSEANHQGEEKVKTARIRAENEVLLMKEIMEEKEEAARKVVLSRLF